MFESIRRDEEKTLFDKQFENNYDVVDETLKNRNYIFYKNAKKAIYQAVHCLI